MSEKTKPEILCEKIFNAAGVLTLSDRSSPFLPIMQYEWNDIVLAALDAYDFTRSKHNVEDGPEVEIFTAIQVLRLIARANPFFHGESAKLWAQSVIDRIDNNL